jgi:hypothetical protein
MDTSDEVTKSMCTDIIQSSMCQLRYRLKKEYWDKIKNISHKEAYKLKPQNILEKSWKDLVDRWFDAHFQVLKFTLPSKHHIHVCYMEYYNLHIFVRKCV